MSVGGLARRASVCVRLLCALTDKSRPWDYWFIDVFINNRIREPATQFTRAARRTTAKTAKTGRDKERRRGGAFAGLPLSAQVQVSKGKFEALSEGWGQYALAGIQGLLPPFPVWAEAQWISLQLGITDMITCAHAIGRACYL